MNIVLMASGFKTRDIEYNKNKILNAINTIAQKDDLLVFGESFLHGFDALYWDYKQDQNIAVSIHDEVINEICEACKKKEVNVSFGYYEKDGDSIYSSQITIGQDAKIIDNYRRVSIGWKVKEADSHYKEGKGFHLFSFQNKKVAIGLCGDLWYEDNIEEMTKLHPDLVLWPVYTDFDANEWNESIVYEYTEQASKLNALVCYVNSVCEDKLEGIHAKGGAAFFKDNKILKSTEAGEETYCSLER